MGKRRKEGELQEKAVVRLSIDVDAGLRRRLKFAALSAGVTVREYITAALLERLENGKDEKE